MEVSICVAIITRNRPSMLRMCLEQVASLTEAPAEVVVVDASDDDASSIVCRGFPNVKHVGFPGGRHQMPASRNIACVNATADFIAYIDDDCMVEAEWLSSIRRTYQEYPDAIGVGGLVIDERWKFDPAKPVCRVDNLGRVTANCFGDPGGVQDVDILPGGNMSFRRETLLRVGGFDPGYTGTNHREDPDLCLRVRAIGGRILYQPAARVHHLNARNALGELKQWHEFFLRYSFTRNDTYFVLKHFGGVVPAVLRTLFQDSVRFVVDTFKKPSLGGIAIIPVYFVAKWAGIVAALHYRFMRPKNHFPPKDTSRKRLQRP